MPTIFQTVETHFCVKVVVAHSRETAAAAKAAAAAAAAAKAVKWMKKKQLVVCNTRCVFDSES